MKRMVVAYLCSALDEETKADRKITTDSPAATNKVLAIAKAAKLAAIRVVVLSLGRGRKTGEASWHRSKVRRSTGVTMIYCVFVNLPVLTHLVTMLSLLFHVKRLAKRHPDLILIAYNRAYHYVPALVFARILGIQSHLDLEDGYGYVSSGYWGWRRIRSEITCRLFDWLCPDGAVTANVDLAKQLGTQRSFVCYGVVESSRELRQNWENEPLQVLFSGTLLKDVGSEMLISAIKILQKNKPDFFDRLHFVVSGKGPYAKQFRSLSEQMPEWLTFFDVLPRESYLNILGESHVGVSLRLSKYEMSATTFPSKVVEYSDFGLLLVTTRVSDVPILFGDGAIYLEKEEASELAKVFVSLVGRSDELRAMAQTGRAHMVSKCSKEFVASRLSSLLENKL